LKIITDNAWGVDIADLFLVWLFVLTTASLWGPLLIEKVPSAVVVAVILSKVVGYFLLFYGLVGQTPVQIVLRVVVVNKKCEKIGPLLGLARFLLFSLTLFLFMVLFGHVGHHGRVPIYDQICGTFLVEKKSLKALLSRLGQSSDRETRGE